MFGRSIIKMFAGKKRYQHFFESLGNIAHAVRYIGYTDINNKFGTETYYIRQLFGDASSDKLVIFDVGANVGDYSETVDIISKINQKPYTLFAFEPAKKTYERLAKRFEGNGNIKCLNFGMSDKEGETTLYADSENSDLASVYNLETPYRKFDDRFKETIKLDTIDHFIQQHGIDYISYLKIDAEGHDFYVLKGAPRALAEKRIRAIQFEFGPPNIDSKIFVRDFWNLLSADYDIYRLLDNDIYPVKRYVPQLEVFLTTNFLALLKK